MKLAVIGAGPGGMMAAIAAANGGASVTLFEKNEKTGKKLYISGKGRCNVTNDCSVAEFLQNIVSNSRFLQSAAHRFTAEDTMNFCRENGVPVKVERGNRVFPCSDKSSDVIKAFNRALQNSGVNVVLNCPIKQVSATENGKYALKTPSGEEVFDRVIVATGGVSYKATGCDGFGYEVAARFGHDITPLAPALCRILCGNTRRLEGLSLKNVTVSFERDGKVLASEFGEMLFTDDGVSGPAALSLSSQINRLGKTGDITIDLKPALDEKTLDARILRDFSDRMNRDFQNSLDALLPERIAQTVVEQSGISPYKKVNKITAAERASLVATLKCLRFPFVSLDKIDFGIVTAGGVCVKQINPSTMESKLRKGLYFCGEVLDVDAYTGGFNIQTALCTGFLAGSSAAKE